MKKKQYSVEFSKEAEDDFDSSYEYYAKESGKVADSFYKQVNQSLDIIKNNPQIYQKAFKNIRRHVLRGMPPGA